MTFYCFSLHFCLYLDGDMPIFLLNILQKQDAPEKPTASEISSTDISVPFSISAELVKGDEYTVTLFVPEGYTPVGLEVKDNICIYSFVPDKTGSFDIEIKFEN